MLAQILLSIAPTFFAGFMAGYGIRAAMSQVRRSRARRRSYL